MYSVYKKETGQLAIISRFFSLIISNEVLPVHYAVMSLKIVVDFLNCCEQT